MTKKIVFRNISEHDLVCTGRYLPGVTSEQERDKILWDLGSNPYDLNHPVEVFEGEHRTLAGKAVNCKLFLLVERRDPEWLNSGFASLEAICSYRGTYQIDVKQAEREL